MTSKQDLVNEIQALPEYFIDDIFNYILFLKQRKTSVTSETALASEYSLAKDWLKPEEDAAWENL